MNLSMNDSPPLLFNLVAASLVISLSWEPPSVNNTATCGIFSPLSNKNNHITIKYDQKHVIININYTLQIVFNTTK